ncbi:SH3 domain containing protein [Coccidioides posadasii C735 delta SOWgp]|uniref:SH3 domain containing protein n=1 Tax=Coccidioides posadasii (strain C735) TaxID=222929 RepID=C5PCT5_COCP7|nr:SH3 domain containing protein [Coccidioides posadasii C735 delta SOWgp]EER24896.1 SH3 domain containing protein [Coccidioides posadasii C735 delta SOWgp]|eukprot:XP_003067041.1 SH3 domain containing protein [Coccidioides posadasii C735 delta SOWgp]
MTRPQISRAETADLQESLSPSPHGRHQGQALRNAERDTPDEIADPRRDVHHRIDEEYNYSDQDDTDHLNGLHGDRMGGYQQYLEEDAADDDMDDHLDDDMLDKISSSPSIDDEDIDFEFVYALHTFFATVEGQANATKGDTMVLLDDSNSYWWLVRVVKDGSIGYLPAEHIETPTERVARFNKHRNIDLSATMLSDNAEKPKNSLKKAIRRRNAKTVTFASPTYFEASDIDYSTEEEDIDDQLFDEEGIREEEGEGEYESELSDIQGIREESSMGNMKVEPLRPKPQADRDHSQSQDEESTDRTSEQTRDSEESANQQEEFRHGRSRNGVFRNTDSFFKDDTVETKKISLTPNLLRDDANESSQVTDTKEMRGRGSFEALIGDRSKDEKKRKEKKSGMLSGLFKRKDRKSKAFEDDGEEHEKVSEESARSSTERKLSTESLKEETPPSKPQAAPQRHPSKLQKQPRGGSPQTVDSTTPSKNHKSSVRAVAPDLNGDTNPAIHTSPSVPRHDPSFTTTTATSASDSVSNSAVSSPLSPSFQNTPAPSVDVVDKPAELSIRAVAPLKEENNLMSPKESHESGSRGPSLDIQGVNDLPVLSTKRLSNDDGSISTRSLSQPSSDILDIHQTKTDTTAPASTVVSPVHSPIWNDAGLRAYLEDGSDIRDLIIIVHDKSNVLPAGPDHPVTGNLFKDESRSLNEMSNRLDDMLNGWLARKSTVAVK